MSSRIPVETDMRKKYAIPPRSFSQDNRDHPNSALIASTFSMFKTPESIKPPIPTLRKKNEAYVNSTDQEDIALKNRIRNSTTGAITMSEIGIGAYQIAQGQKNPLEMIAKHAHPKGETPWHYYDRLVDQKNPIVTPTQYKDLTNIFHKALVLHGVATITGGVSGAMRLTSGIMESRADWNAINILKKHSKQKIEIARKLKNLDEIKGTQDHSILKEKIDAEMAKMNEKESNIFKKIQKVRSVSTDVNAGAWALGGAAGVISGAGMLNVAFHRNAIAAATAGFLGHVAAPGLITAIQVASAMYGAGVIMGNGHSVVNGAFYLRDRLSGVFKNPENTEKLAKRMANGAMIGGAGRCLSGAGELINLMTKTGFPVFATLNWGEVLLSNGGLLAVDKLLTWLQAPARVISGAVGISSGFKQRKTLKKIEDNRSKGIYKISKEDNALVHEALVNSGNFVNSGLL